MSEVCYVFIRLLGHVFQLWCKLRGKNARIEETMSLTNGLCNTELNVGHSITTGFNEDGDDKLSDLVLLQDWHDSGEGFNGGHSVVIPLLLCIKALDNLGNEVFDRPICSESLCNLTYLDDSHFSH